MTVVEQQVQEAPVSQGIVAEAEQVGAAGAVRTAESRDRTVAERGNVPGQGALEIVEASNRQAGDIPRVHTGEQMIDMPVQLFPPAVVAGDPGAQPSPS